MENTNTTFELIDPEKDKQEIVEQPVIKENDDILEGDFEEARANFKVIIKTGSKAIEDLGQLASMTQDAEHYASLATLIKNVSDLSTNLLKLHKQKKELTGGVGPNKIENHLHMMATTHEMAKILKGIKDEDL